MTVTAALKGYKPFVLADLDIEKYKMPNPGVAAGTGAAASQQMGKLVEVSMTKQ